MSRTYVKSTRYRKKYIGKTHACMTNIHKWIVTIGLMTHWLMVLEPCDQNFLEFLNSVNSISSIWPLWTNSNLLPLPIWDINKGIIILSFRSLASSSRSNIIQNQTLTWDPRGIVHSGGSTHNVPLISSTNILFLLESPTMFTTKSILISFVITLKP